jgi:hypothetical protein
MAEYTTELRTLCEFYAGQSEHVGASDVLSVIDTARPSIFTLPYHIYDETHRAELERSILLHYWTREIGLETPGAFVLALGARMREIMPRYNELYRSAAEAEKVNVITGAADYTITRDHESESDTETETNTTDTSKYSDTPGGALTGLEDDRYLSSAEMRDGNIKSTGKDSGTSKETETMSGTRGGDYAGNYARYFAAVQSIDELIIKDLAPLFMGIY